MTDAQDKPPAADVEAPTGRDVEAAKARVVAGSAGYLGRFLGLQLSDARVLLAALDDRERRLKVAGSNFAATVEAHAKTRRRLAAALRAAEEQRGRAGLQGAVLDDIAEALMSVSGVYDDVEHQIHSHADELPKAFRLLAAALQRIDDATQVLVPADAATPPPPAEVVPCPICADKGIDVCGGQAPPPAEVGPVLCPHSRGYRSSPYVSGAMCLDCKAPGRVALDGAFVAAAPTPSPTAEAAGSGLTEAEREAVGRLVREVWIAWGREQPKIKPSWLLPWEALDEPGREVDRRIGEACARWGADAALAALRGAR